MKEQYIFLWWHLVGVNIRLPQEFGQDSVRLQHLDGYGGNTTLLKYDNLSNITNNVITNLVDGNVTLRVDCEIFPPIISSNPIKSPKYQHFQKLKKKFHFYFAQISLI